LISITAACCLGVNDPVCCAPVLKRGGPSRARILYYGFVPHVKPTIKIAKAAGICYSVPGAAGPAAPGGRLPAGYARQPGGGTVHADQFMEEVDV